MKGLQYLALFAIAGGVSGDAPRRPTAREAHAFLGLLSTDQKKAALLPFDAEAKADWHYVPRSRPGVAWRNLTPEQRQSAHALLRASLSRAGYEKIEALRDLEPILREMEGGNPGRDPERYHFVFFGEPSDERPWAWRYEGHHLSLTFAYRDGRLVSSTPQFLGSNPAEVPSGPNRGRRVLAKEQDLALELASSLTEAQLAKAKIGAQAPGDIVTGNARRAAIEGRKGLPYRDLTEPQRKLLMDLLKAHAEVQSEKEQARRLEMIRKEELNRLVFAWMGPLERRSRHYYRIQGGRLLIEYDNTQSDGNHIHTVWRDLAEDFGQDALLDHYRHGHYHDHR